VRRLDTVFRDIRVARQTFDFPNVNPNSSLCIDLVATGLEVSTNILCWAPVETALTFDDLMLQWLCLDTDLIRVTMINPTGMMISPGTIELVFVFGVVKDEVVDTVTIANF